jgi:hypothetical protein
METVEETNRRVQQKAEQIIASITLIPEIANIDVKPYTDNTGDQALQLSFRLRPGVQVDADFFRRFNDFAGRIQTAILHSDLDRFPYTRIEEAA